MPPNREVEGRDENAGSAPRAHTVFQCRSAAASTHTPQTLVRQHATNSPDSLVGRIFRGNGDTVKPEDLKIRSRAQPRAGGVSMAEHGTGPQSGDTARAALPLASQGTLR